ncbi:hypothetical protein QQ045_020639 [Rhodiola kirilowii]
MASDIHRSTVATESAVPKRSPPSRKRRRILHTCAVSMLATADRASAKVTVFNGPFGFVMNRVIGFVTTKGPFAGLYRFQTHLLLLVLSFVDDRVLKVENIVEDHFPSSSFVFDKIDNVVSFTESMPEKIDQAADKVSLVVNKFPPLSSCVAKLVHLVNLLISQLRAWWRSEYVGNTKERDIMVDTNCDKNRHGKTKRVVCDEAVCQIELHPLTTSHTTSLDDKFQKSGSMKEEPDTKICNENRATNTDECVPKCSYKEVLEKGRSFKEVLEKGISSYKDVLEKGIKGEAEGQLEEEAVKDCNSKGNNLKQVENIKVENSCTTDNVVQGNGDGMVNGGNDPILELFESAWHMT